MAFTIAEIEKALTTDIPGLPPWPRSDRAHAERQQTPDYPIIIDYLTGQITSLQGLQVDINSDNWPELVNLLGNIDIPGSNEQLVLDIIYLSKNPYSRFNFNRWLILQAFSENNDARFYSAVEQFRKQGMNDAEIFEELAVGVADRDTLYLSIKNSALGKFLFEFVTKSNQLIKPKSYYSWSISHWSLFYFTLLDEAKPAFAIEYALQHIFTKEDYPVGFFVQYKNGLYIPALVSFIDNPGIVTEPYHVVKKFRPAIILVETDEEKYKSLVVQLSHRYLDYFWTNYPKKTWEIFYPLQLSAGEERISLPYSSVAVHFLLKYEKQTTLSILKEWFSKKIYVDFKTLTILCYHLQQEAYPYIEQVMKAAVVAGIDYYRSCIELLRKNFEPGQYLELLWSLTNSKIKSLRQLIASTLAETDKEAEEKAIALLNHKNSETRQTAATILSYSTTEKSKAAVINALNKEANDNARDILLQTIAESLPKEPTQEFIDEVIEAAKQRKKLTKPLETWLNEDDLPALYLKNGNKADILTTRFLLYRMSRTAMQSDVEAKYIINLLDKDKTSAFALEIIKRYLENGAKPEHKYLLALAALLGNDAVVDKIRITTNKWIDEGRYKMAEHGVGALALQGSDKALRWVEWYSRKYKSKKANVGNAALVALETAADELKITIHELGDRIVPDFGFDGLYKHFKVGNEDYRAFIDSNFKIAFFNEDDKKLKSIPAAADAVLKDEFKAIAKEVRDIVKSQSSRLEYYLIIQRKWTFAQWEKFFLQNPVMFIYAAKILWGVYDKEENLTETFLCNEDTSLQDVSGNEISVDENTFIGIIHPTQLDSSLLQQWKQQLFDLAIDSIFPQLDRSVPDMKGIDLSKPIITKFEGRKTVQGSIRSTLERSGWHKGPVGDGGMVESFNLLYFEKKIEAVLEINGVGAGYGWGMEESLGRLFVIDKSKITQKWFNHPDSNEDDRLVKLTDIPAIFLSEMLAAVESIKQVEKE